MNWLNIATQNLQHNNIANFSELDVQRLIVEPILQWLGYDTFNYDVVREQVLIGLSGPKGGEGRADYVLLEQGTVQIVVEAKKMAINTLQDKMVVKQVLDYCSMHPDRPRWGVLTNGKEWHIYDSHATGGAFDRCILKVQITDNPRYIQCLCVKNFELLRTYANSVLNAQTIPDDTSRFLILSLLEQDFYSKLQTDTNKTEPQTPVNPISTDANSAKIKKTPATKQPSSSPSVQIKQIKMPDQRLATYAEYPTPGSKPQKLCIVQNNKIVEIPCATWAEVVTEFTKNLLEHIDNPKELDGWSVTNSQVYTITATKKNVRSPKEIGYKLYLNTSYHSQYLIKIIDALIDKYKWDTTCYWVE